jgi:hypothetical protein
MRLRRTQPSQRFSGFQASAMLRFPRRLIPLIKLSPPVREFALSSFERRLNDIKAQAEAGGGEKRVSAQHAKGKLTARERLSVLLDAGSFREYDQVIGPSILHATVFVCCYFDFARASIRFCSLLTTVAMTSAWRNNISMVTP